MMFFYKIGGKIVQKEDILYIKAADNTLMRVVRRRIVRGRLYYFILLFNVFPYLSFFVCNVLWGLTLFRVCLPYSLFFSTAHKLQEVEEEVDEVEVECQAA